MHGARRVSPHVLKALPRDIILKNGFYVWGRICGYCILLLYVHALWACRRHPYIESLPTLWYTTHAWWSTCRTSLCCLYIYLSLTLAWVSWWRESQNLNLQRPVWSWADLSLPSPDHYQVSLAHEPTTAEGMCILENGNTYKQCSLDSIISIFLFGQLHKCVPQSFPSFQSRTQLEWWWLSPQIWHCRGAQGRQTGPSWLSTLSG